MTSAWETFAKTHNLIFTPPRFFRTRARVAGSYRGYQLQIADLSANTEIMLVAAQSYEPLLAELEAQAGEIFEPGDIHRDLLSLHLLGELGGYLRPTERGQKFYYQSITPMYESHKDPAILQRLLDRLCDLANAYRELVAWGGEALPAIQAIIVQSDHLSELARHLLRHIGQETSLRLGPQAAHLICARCQAGCNLCQITLGPLLDEVELNYYGCVACGQSRRFI